VIRAVGGLLFLIGSLIMVYNIWMTIRGTAEREAATGHEDQAPHPMPAE
jgi:cytochrome c oxidase cbb3-type subunit 1